VPDPTVAGVLADLPLPQAAKARDSTATPVSAPIRFLITAIPLL
jgi:hypothetical protein